MVSLGHTFAQLKRFGTKTLLVFIFLALNVPDER